MISLAIPLAVAAAQALLPSLVSRIAGDKSGDVAERALGAVLDVAQVAAPDRGDAHRIRAAIAAVQGSPEHMAEAVSRLAEIEEAERQAELLAIVEQAKTARAELKTGDRFIQRARPAAIWASILLTSALVVSGIVLVFTNPEGLALLRELIDTLEWVMLALLGVAGVYTGARTLDKRAGKAGGEAPERREFWG